MSWGLAYAITLSWPSDSGTSLGRDSSISSPKGCGKAIVREVNDIDSNTEKRMVDEIFDRTKSGDFDDKVRGHMNGRLNE